MNEEEELQRIIDMTDDEVLEESYKRWGVEETELMVIRSRELIRKAVADLKRRAEERK